MRNPSWNLACGPLRDEDGVIHALCLVYVDDFILACSDSPFGNMSLTALTICTNGQSGSHECSNSGAQITQAYDKHTGTFGGFEISFAEYAKETSINAETGNPKSNQLSCPNFEP